jgi:hypothetical protein
LGSKSTVKNGLAVPGFKVNMPRHIGGKSMLFFNTASQKNELTQIKQVGRRSSSNLLDFVLPI